MLYLYSGIPAFEMKSKWFFTPSSSRQVLSPALSRTDRVSLILTLSIFLLFSIFIWSPKKDPEYALLNILITASE